MLYRQSRVQCCGYRSSPTPAPTPSSHAPPLPSPPPLSPTMNFSSTLSRALMKKPQTRTGAPKNATCPLQSRRILSKARKISLRGWWIVTTMPRPVSASAWRLFRISREEAESKPDESGTEWRLCFTALQTLRDDKLSERVKKSPKTGSSWELNPGPSELLVRYSILLSYWSPLAEEQ